MGLLRFAPETAAALKKLPGVTEEDGVVARAAGIIDGSPDRSGKPVPIDLYEHVTIVLTGQWTAGPDDARMSRCC